MDGNQPGRGEKLEEANVSNEKNRNEVNSDEIGKQLKELRLSYSAKWKNKYAEQPADDPIGPYLHEKLKECAKKLEETGYFANANANKETNGCTAPLKLPGDFKWGDISKKIDEEFERLSLEENKEEDVNKNEPQFHKSLRGNAFTGISYRRFQPEDIFGITETNLDPMVETYGVGFYLHYAVQFSEYFVVAEHNKRIVAYIMGKDEGEGDNYHGHVTALTVVGRFRKRGIATYLMKGLEETSIRKNCYFVDLFVRKSNVAAIKLYESLGYIVYREIIDYYTGEKPENAYDMRKALPRDVKKKSVIPLKHPVHANDAD